MSDNKVPVEPARERASRPPFERPQVWIPIIAGSLALVAVAAFLMWPRGVEPTASTTPSPSVTPSATPLPTEPTIEPAVIEGFAPVPQLPASEIPWDEVGPGWFVIDYATGDSPNVDDTGWIDYPESQGGVSLLSPDGAWFAAVKHADLGAGPVGAWDGTHLWMLREATTNFESIQSRSELVNLRDGGRTPVPGESSGQVFPFQAGRSLYYAWGGDGLVNSVAAMDKSNEMGGCSDVESGFWGWEAQDMSFLYGPWSGGGVVCFGPGEVNGTTAVKHVDVTALEGTMTINTFSQSPMNYSFVGWIDENRFFFARTSGASPVLFTYDLRDDAIVELELPIYDKVNGWNTTGFFDTPSQRHVIAARDGDGWAVNLAEVNGGEVASLAGECGGDVDQYSRADVRTSGGRLVVTCQNPGYVEMYDLEGGQLIGRWDVGMERQTAVFDAPDN